MCGYIQIDDQTQSLPVARKVVQENLFPALPHSVSPHIERKRDTEKTRVYTRRHREGGEGAQTGRDIQATRMEGSVRRVEGSPRKKNNNRAGEDPQGQLYQGVLSLSMWTLLNLFVYLSPYIYPSIPLHVSVSTYPSRPVYPLVYLRE